LTGTGSKLLAEVIVSVGEVICLSRRLLNLTPTR